MNAIDVIKQVAEDEVKKLNLLELGIVTSVFPHAGQSDNENNDCSVRLKNRDNFELRHVPIATHVRGFACVPNIGDLVVVAFLSGDINAPVVIGKLYNDQDRPPENKNEYEVMFEPFGKGRIWMNFPTAGGVTFTLDDDLLKLEAGGTVITLNKDGSVKIDVKKNLEITSPDYIKLSAKGDLTLEGNNINVTAQNNATVKANMTAKMEGTTTEVKASANGKVEASATLEVKSSGPLTIQGAIVNIN
jgi:phage baseplate assembly protein gpV